jgi:hypothetical protein
MSEPQIIWLTQGAKTFAGLCEECLAAPDDPFNSLAYREAKVCGRLRADADVGFTRCDRGHPIRVRRLTHSAA